ncbi:MAG: right-handed parallel beta-helix repeat-containing protein, partial [Candidatus Aenigmarchaeota archaeon]|nr:right-handed parallel beta-helix repeat-containing protein [Candidatus Aenigmarchaeota archaeon]
YAKGIYPDNWTMISSGSAPVTGGELGEWNAWGVENGLYTIKLLVHDTNNEFIDYAHITIDNQPLGITINSPLNTTYFSPVTLFDITSEFGAVSCNYSVDGQLGVPLENGDGTSGYYNWTRIDTDISRGAHNVVFSCENKYGAVNSTKTVWFNIDANTVTGCSVLDEADSAYYLISDISNHFAAGACINITASNVTLYCQSHFVDGIGSVDTYGVYAGADNAGIFDGYFSDWDSGIYLNESSGGTVANNVITASQQYGIYIDGAEANTIYNNFFSNTENAGISNELYSNNWNTTRQVEDRIYSLGNEIGGNYWSSPAGAGCSDTCVDADNDGFCDTPCDKTSDNADRDYLALSNKCLNLNISSCQVLDIDNMNYQLQSDVNSGNICFTVNASGITLDCNGHTITGNGTGNGIDALAREKGIKDVAISNCVIDDFYIGVYLSKYYYSAHSLEKFYLTNVSSSG